MDVSVYSFEIRYLGSCIRDLGCGIRDQEGAIGDLGNGSGI